jgi:uncharacterized membrane protein YhaH (DUF805 family)
MILMLASSIGLSLIRIDYIITAMFGVLYVVSWVSRIRGLKFLGWVPISTIVSAFIAGISLFLVLINLTHISSATLFRLLPYISNFLFFFMFWNIAKAVLDGMVETKKIKLSRRSKYVVEIFSWLFYLLLILIQLI